MMRLPPFRFLEPRSVSEAVAAIAADPTHSRFVAGGTDLWPNMKRGLQHTGTVISLAGIEELGGIAGSPAGEVRIGAMTRLAQITNRKSLAASHPSLVRAVGTISSPVLREMGTIGGNLCLDTRCSYYNQGEAWRNAISFCMKERGEVCWVAPGSSRCWAVASSDAAPFLCAIGARARLVSTRGERVVDLIDLYRDDGIDYLAKDSDELLVEVLVPALTGCRATYWKLRRRGSIDFPVLSVAAWIRADKALRVEEARIVLGAVASAPIEARDASASLAGRRLDEETIAHAAWLAAKVATPMNNTDTEVPWRKRMARAYVEGALRELAALEQRIRPPAGSLATAAGGAR